MASKSSARVAIKPAAPKFPTVDPRSVESFDKPEFAEINQQLVKPKPKIDRSDERKVNVMVPKTFRLTDNDHSEHLYNAGFQKMPRAHAEHWFAVTNGVTIQEP